MASSGPVIRDIILATKATVLATNFKGAATRDVVMVMEAIVLTTGADSPVMEDAIPMMVANGTVARVIALTIDADDLVIRDIVRSVNSRGLIIRPPTLAAPIVTINFDGWFENFYMSHKTPKNILQKMIYMYNIYV